MCEELVASTHSHLVNISPLDSSKKQQNFASLGSTHWFVTLRWRWKNKVISANLLRSLFFFYWDHFFFSTEITFGFSTEITLGFPAEITFFFHFYRKVQNQFLLLQVPFVVPNSLCKNNTHWFVQNTKCAFPDGYKNPSFVDTELKANFSVDICKSSFPQLTWELSNH